jgi:hypothetical protein
MQQGGGEVSPGFGVVRVELDGASEALDGAGESFEFELDAAESEPGGGVEAVDLEGLRVGFCCGGVVLVADVVLAQGALSSRIMSFRYLPRTLVVVRGAFEVA